MKKIKITDLKSIHLELSSFCNLNCPFCGRQTGPIPERMNKNLSKKAIDNLLIPELICNLKNIDLCGNFGEPTLSPNFTYFIGRMKKLNPDCIIWISTNGSTHTPEWWYYLGKALRKTNVYMSFCLDGLTDETNKYRGSSVEKVRIHMENYLRGVGGKRVEWKITAFEHNQCDIEEIREITKQKGIKLDIKYSWFYDNDEYKKPTVIIPEAESIYNPRCTFLQDGLFFVTTLGEVLPCCHIIPDFFEYPHLSLEDHTIDKIIESTPFKSLLLHINKNSECRKHCGI